MYRFTRPVNSDRRCRADTPFKLFTLCAGAFEMRPFLFMAAVFIGRLIRFAISAYLTLRFGPGIVHTVRIFFSHHFHWLVIAVVVGLAAWLLWRRYRRAKLQTFSGSENIVEQ